MADPTVLYPFGTAKAPLPAAELLTLEKLLASGGATLNTPEDLRCALAGSCYLAQTFAPPPAPLKAGTIKVSAAAASAALGGLARGQHTPAALKALPWGQVWAIVQALIAAWIAAHGG